MNKYIIASALVAFSLSSCNDFLDVQPEGDAMTTNFFTNDQQSIDAIDRVYEDLPVEDMFGRNLFYEQAAANDIVWGRSRGFNTLASREYTGDESPLRDTFTRFYNNIARCNYIIHGLMRKGVDNLSYVETRTLGEAFFQRGFCHFWIAHRYGTDKLGCPFVRWEDYLPGEYDNTIPPQLPTVMDNYKYIVEDMENAIKYLPKFEDYDVANQGRAHQAAALGYKAKTFAYWATWEPSKWNDVITCVNELESKYGRGLADSYEEIFGWDFADFWNREYMWSFPSNSGSYGSQFGGCKLPGVMLVNKSWPILTDATFGGDGYNGWGYIKPTNQIYEEFLKDGEDNKRMRYSMLSYGDEFEWVGTNMRFYDGMDYAAGFMVYKYQHQYGPANCFKDGIACSNADNGMVRINFPLMRFAEMLLFRAEANIMLGKGAEATKDLNAIRKRSGLSEISSPATMKELYHERRCELAFEYTNYLFDLKRWARSSDATIKAIALAELNAQSMVRLHEDRKNPDSDYEVIVYQGCSEKIPYQDYMMTFPYPSLQVVNSNGALKQLPEYQ